MTDKDPFVEALAEFRGISYEAAAAQHEKDQDHLEILFTEAVITGEDDPSSFAELAEKDLMFELGQGKGTIIAEHGRLLPVPRLTTPEEDDRFLIEDTERKLVGDTTPMQKALNAACGIEPDAKPVTTVLLPAVRTARRE